jgi:hypothetical protein
LLAVCCVFSAVACSHGTTHPADSTSALATVPAATVSPSSAPPTTSTHPSATATTPLLTGAAVRPGETPPTIDTYVNHDNASGALAFAAYFYRALDWSIATTNPDLLRPISASTCTECERYIHEIDDVEAAGGYSRGGRIDVTNLAIAHGNLVKADFVVQVMAWQETQVLVSSAGASPTSYPSGAGPATNYLYVSWRNGWQALEIGGP